MKYYIDTNYFLRFFLNDNPVQSSKVRDLFKKGSRGEVELVSSVVVFLEVYWVLSSYYQFSKEQVVKSLKAMLKFDFISFDQEVLMGRAVNIFEDNNLDIEDCFHLASLEMNDCKLASFDVKLKNFSKKSKF